METLIANAEIIKVTSITLGVLLTIVSLLFLRKSIYDQHQWNRNVKSLDFSLAEDPKYMEIMKVLDEKYEINHGGAVQIEYKDAVDTKISNDLQFILARFEAMAISIKKSIVNEDICKAMHKQRVISLVHSCEPYISELRGIRKNRFLYINLINLAKKWEGNNEATESSPLGTGLRIKKNKR